MIVSLYKEKMDESRFKEIMYKSECHKHLHFSYPYSFIIQKWKKHPNGCFMHVFFETTIILIFGGLFMHHLSWIYQVSFKWLKVPTAEFSKEIWAIIYQGLLCWLATISFNTYVNDNLLINCNISLYDINRDEHI